jgi:hypothetical protein
MTVSSKISWPYACDHWSIYFIFFFLLGGSAAEQF